MFKSTLSLVLGSAVAALVTFPASSARAESPHFRYVDLDLVPLPAPFVQFSPSVVVGGKVFGTVMDDTGTVSKVAVFGNGTLQIGPQGTASTANDGGVIGGATLALQAALFSGNTTTLIPRISGLAFEHVIGLTDTDLALVQSTNDAFNGSTFSYFRAGKETQINFGLPDPVLSAFMNQGGEIGLNKVPDGTDQLDRGYRYDPRTRTSTLLPPFAADKTEVNVLIQGINVRNEVLGSSFTNGATYHEHVGIWNAAGVFEPFIRETIQASALVFNDSDEIVITSSPSTPFSDDTQCFLVPAPGTRLDLAPLVRGIPTGLHITQCLSIDNLGNIAGVSRDAMDNVHSFVLQPVVR